MNIRINNCFVFDEETTFSLTAQPSDNTLPFNVYKANGFDVLKSTGLFGPNSTGKTCLLKCIQVIKEMFLNRELSLKSNIYSDSDICELGIVFMHENNKYSYDIHYNVKTKAYVYERFIHSYKDSSGKDLEELWLLKDTINHEYRCLDKTLENILIAMSRDSLVVYLVDTDQFNIMKKIKSIIQAFANKIEVINIKDIPLQQTEELVKKHKDLKGEVIEFMLETGLFSEDKKDMEVYLDHFVYRPCIYQRIATLAIYTIVAIEQGGILAIDGLDNRNHYQLTKALASMFNSELNTKGQLIFTECDTNLMDTNKLFRKDQLWFVHRDETGVYVYSLEEVVD